MLVVCRCLQMFAGPSFPFSFRGDGRHLQLSSSPGRAGRGGGGRATAAAWSLASGCLYQHIIQRINATFFK